MFIKTCHSWIVFLLLFSSCEVKWTPKSSWVGCLLHLQVISLFWCTEKSALVQNTATASLEGAIEKIMRTFSGTQKMTIYKFTSGVVPKMTHIFDKRMLNLPPLDGKPLLLSFLCYLQRLSLYSCSKIVFQIAQKSQVIDILMAFFFPSQEWEQMGGWFRVSCPSLRHRRNRGIQKTRNMMRPCLYLWWQSRTEQRTSGTLVGNLHCANPATRLWLRAPAGLRGRFRKLASPL